MRRELEGKRILVTGASSGIGYQIALDLARKGAHVLATARRADRLAQLESAASSTGKTIHILSGDLTEDSFRAELIAECDAQLGGLDGLVNNAGAGAIGLFQEASPERMRQVMEIDFFSAVELTRRALPLIHQGEQPFILIVGSVLGHRGVSRKSEYCAAKFAIRGWSESLRCELRDAGISVIMISPSTTRSEFFAALLDTKPSETSRSLGSMSPESVSAATIRAIERDRREVILSFGGRCLVFAAKHFPGLLDRFT